MESKPPPASQSDLDLWLENLGFSRGNPFATVEADREREVLPEFFVEVDGYERIKANDTIVVFAPRGGGKSALRVQLASYAAPQQLDSHILAIEYTDVGALVATHRSQGGLRIEDHTFRLLREGTRALLQALCGDEALPGDANGLQIQAARIDDVSPPTRARIARLIRTYHPVLLSVERLYERLNALDVSFSPAWSEFVAAAEAQQLASFFDEVTTSTDGICHFLVELNDCQVSSYDTTASAKEQMEYFIATAQSAGFLHVHFLIDRIDEHQSTADDPVLQADILEPLLADLTVLELDNVAFKFFLSRKTRDVLMRRPTIRRDRLRDQALTVEWDEPSLSKLLRERLAFYSSGKIADVAQICQGEKGEWFEEELLHHAGGSPRWLLVAGQLVCEAHIERYGPAGRLEKDDWEVARPRILERLQPKLVIHRDERVAQLGARRVQLTEKDYDILRTLAEVDDVCGRDTLIKYVWKEEDVNDYAIDAAIGRLRDKLGDNPRKPLYIETVRGEGFRLKNYTLVGEEDG